MLLSSYSVPLSVHLHSDRLQARNSKLVGRKLIEYLQCNIYSNAVVQYNNTILNIYIDYKSNIVWGMTY